MPLTKAVDLVDPDVYVQGVPYAEFARLRAEDPVSWHEEKNGSGYWAITRFDDICEISRKPELFSSAHKWGGHRLFNEHEVGVANAGDAAIGIPFVSHDPPIHTQYRKFAMPSVSPSRLGDIEARICQRAETLVKAMPLDEDVDIVTALNGPLPLLTLAELLGLPADMWVKLYDWTNAFVGEDDPDYRQTAERMQTVMAEFLAFCHDLFNARRANPGSDIGTLLANTKIDGQDVAFSDFVANMILVLVGGNETTRNSLSQTMLRFTEHPDQWHLVRSDPAILKTAVKEMVRHATPVHHMRRTATQDLDLHGKSVRQGDKIVMWYVSGNRDPEKFDDPDRFDLSRTGVNHVGFGSGVHVCIGSRLAEMQLRVAFTFLSQRVKRFELVEPPQRLRSNFIHGLKTLKLRLVSA